jgi:hypothetical protein
MALGLELGSKRNDYQKISCGVKRSRRVRLTSPPSVSRLSKKCGVFDVSQPFRPPRPVTGIVLLSFLILSVNVSSAHYALTRALLSSNKRNSIQCCQLKFFQCSQQIAQLFNVYVIFTATYTYM